MSQIQISAQRLTFVFESCHSFFNPFKVQGIQQPLWCHIASWLYHLVTDTVSSGLKYKNIYITHCGQKPLSYTSQFITYTFFTFVVICKNVTLPQVDFFFFLHGLQLDI